MKKKLPELTRFVRGTSSSYCWGERVRPAELFIVLMTINDLLGIIEYLVVGS